MIPEKFGVVAYALSGDPRQVAELSQHAGFAGLQFDAFSPNFSLPELSRTGQREFMRLLNTHNQQLIALRADLGPKGFGPGADVDRLLAQLHHLLETTADLMTGQSPLVCLEIGALPPPPLLKTPPRATAAQAGALILSPGFTAAPAPETTPLPTPAAVDPILAAQTKAALAELGALAERFSVNLAFRSELASLGAIEQALQQANCSWFGVDLDPAAALRDAWGIDEIFSRLGSQVRHVRARDANIGSERRTRPAILGQGDSDWPALLSNLDQASFNGWITLDPIELSDRATSASAGLKYLRKLIEP